MMPEPNWFKKKEDLNDFIKSFDNFHEKNN